MAQSILHTNDHSGNNNNNNKLQPIHHGSNQTNGLQHHQKLHNGNNNINNNHNNGQNQSQLHTNQMAPNTVHISHQQSPQHQQQPPQPQQQSNQSLLPQQQQSRQPGLSRTNSNMNSNNNHGNNNNNNNNNINSNNLQNNNTPHRPAVHSDDSFEIALTEGELLGIIVHILRTNPSVPIGKLGSAIHISGQDYRIPAYLKKKYGGLKRLLTMYPDLFAFRDDHPFNPTLELLVSDEQLPDYVTRYDPNRNKNNNTININTPPQQIQ
jgi:hypothetical protein